MPERLAVSPELSPLSRGIKRLVGQLKSISDAEVGIKSTCQLLRLYVVQVGEDELGVSVVYRE
jgi:hypothetical protein